MFYELDRNDHAAPTYGVGSGHGIIAAGEGLPTLPTLPPIIVGPFGSVLTDPLESDVGGPTGPFREMDAPDDIIVIS
jgi:hypothetical protein